MNRIKTLTLAAVAAFSCGAANAATVYASNVDSYTQGSGIKPADAPYRTNTAHALGAVDGDFLSLGLGGSAIFSFGAIFGSPLSTFEITWGKVEAHVEIAKVYGLLSGVMTYLGEVNNQGQSSLTFTGKFDQLKLVDVSDPQYGSKDGFDVDAISVSTVPVPAAGFLLLGALGGLAAARRRKA